MDKHGLPASQVLNSLNNPDFLRTCLAAARAEKIRSHPCNWFHRCSISQIADVYSIENNQKKQA